MNKLLMLTASLFSLGFLHNEAQASTAMSLNQKKAYDYDHVDSEKQTASRSPITNKTAPVRIGITVPAKPPAAPIQSPAAPITTKAAPVRIGITIPAKPPAAPIQSPVVSTVPKAIPITAPVFKVSPKVSCNVVEQGYVMVPSQPGTAILTSAGCGVAKPAGFIPGIPPANLKVLPRGTPLP